MFDKMCDLRCFVDLNFNRYIFYLFSYYILKYNCVCLCVTSCNVPLPLAIERS